MVAVLVHSKKGKKKNGFIRIYEIEIASSPYSMPSFQDFGVELSLLYSFIPIKSFIKYYTLLSIFLAMLIFLFYFICI